VLGKDQRKHAWDNVSILIRSVDERIARRKHLQLLHGTSAIGRTVGRNRKHIGEQVQRDAYHACYHERQSATPTIRPCKRQRRHVHTSTCAGSKAGARSVRVVYRDRVLHGAVIEQLDVQVLGNLSVLAIFKQKREVATAAVSVETINALYTLPDLLLVLCFCEGADRNPGGVIGG
jgi:hypothetical protein